MADVITGSEFLVKEFAKLHSLTATAINDLIKNVLQNPQSNADEADTHMFRIGLRYQSLWNSILKSLDFDIEVIFRIFFDIKVTGLQEHPRVPPIGPPPVWSLYTPV
jgi:hypothetical protein